MKRQGNPQRVGPPGNLWSTNPRPAVASSRWVRRSRSPPRSHAFPPVMGFNVGRAMGVEPVVDATQKSRSVSTECAAPRIVRIGNVGAMGVGEVVEPVKWVPAPMDSAVFQTVRKKNAGTTDAEVFADSAMIHPIPFVRMGLVDPHVYPTASEKNVVLMDAAVPVGCV